MADMTCPKCHGAMRTYERNGVHIDQCTECRGVFLDRGELEHLVDAENRWHGTPAPAAPSAPAHGAQQGPGQGSGHGTAAPGYAAGSAGGLGAVVSEVVRAAGQSRSHSSHSSSYGYPTKRKKSFLDELFG